jgi:hypothetical protein
MQALEEMAMQPTTEPEVTVFIIATSKCPMCSAKIEVQNKLTEESLSTGNHTQRAAYWADSMKKQVNIKRKQRGWTPEMCGKCRDKE